MILIIAVGLVPTVVITMAMQYITIVPTAERRWKGEPMSLYIKGLDMPKGDFIVELITHYEGGEKKDIKFVHKEDIIEIPTPHGRLIDASELIKSYMRGTKTGIDDFYDTIDIIDNAPTILEAEE